ncbi:MAG: hypothetical protein K2P58_02195 [Hyphomonadaceae bacterium]|nr:hypothetical protein [Hyphomonadaceae bacterium]
MTAAEEALYRRLVHGRARALEFGVGGSTLVAMEEQVKHLLSIETDRAWTEAALRTPALAEGVAAGRLEIRHVDVGPVAKWGKPQDLSHRSDWPAYAAAPWPTYADSAPDHVLIDGRFRVACTLQTLLHCPPATTVVIHDFWNRPHYHEVLRFLEWRASVDTMGVFNPRENIDRGAVQTLLERYQYEFA